ncbi:MAG: hypothetical protein A3G93_10975 [Nitrospinae bacterium RIFCSPLOWO2_12_FULL_45_22]|nr:MAG: hypothetical protein A3G93_10975 [Nitrospinae bacterium RIFCSPLOWO2_12_FULL_45_22]
MRTSTEIKERLEKVFDKAQASVLIEVIVDAYGELVKAGDFNELKAIVKELAEAQRRTEIKVAELAEDIRILVRGLGETRSEVGGLSRSVSYALENEAYRGLPKVLKRSYGIELKDRLIRAEIGGKEINIFGRAKRDGRDVLVVGEAKLRLDERRKKGERDVFEELEEKGRAVRWEYGEEEIVSVLITHYATKGFMREAKERNIIVIQSFEW